MQDDNDEIKRSPGTPVFTAPECCLGMSNTKCSTILDILMLVGFSLNAGLPYHGKTADVWAVGVTLYCLTVGQYPFLGDNLQDTYDKVMMF